MVFLFDFSVRIVLFRPVSLLCLLVKYFEVFNSGETKLQACGCLLAAVAFGSTQAIYEFFFFFLLCVYRGEHILCGAE